MSFEDIKFPEHLRGIKHSDIVYQNNSKSTAAADWERDLYNQQTQLRIDIQKKIEEMEK